MSALLRTLLAVLLAGGPLATAAIAVHPAAPQEATTPAVLPLAQGDPKVPEAPQRL